MDVHLDTTASPEALWEVFTDTQQWPIWGPSVRCVASPTRHIRLGTAGRITVTGIGLRLPFEITALEPGRRWCWRVARLPATGHRVELIPGGGRVVFELPPWAFAYAPVCRLACRRIARLAAPAPA